MAPLLCNVALCKLNHSQPIHAAAYATAARPWDPCSLDALHWRAGAVHAAGPWLRGFATALCNLALKARPSEPYLVHHKARIECSGAASDAGASGAHSGGHCVSERAALAQMSPSAAAASPKVHAMQQQMQRMRDMRAGMARLMQQAA